MTPPWGLIAVFTTPPALLVHTSSAGGIAVFGPTSRSPYTRYRARRAVRSIKATILSWDGIHWLCVLLRRRTGTTCAGWSMKRRNGYATARTLTSGLALGTDQLGQSQRIRNGLLRGQTWLVWDDTTAAATITIGTEVSVGADDQPVWPEHKRHEAALYIRRLVVFGYDQAAANVDAAERNCSLIRPHRGHLIFFDGRRHPHYARALRSESDVLVVAVMNFYTESFPESTRPPELNRHLYGDQ